MGTVCTPLTLARADIVLSDATITLDMIETCVTTADEIPLEGGRARRLDEILPVFEIDQREPPRAPSSSPDELPLAAIEPPIEGPTITELARSATPPATVATEPSPITIEGSGPAVAADAERVRKLRNAAVLLLF